MEGPVLMDAVEIEFRKLRLALDLAPKLPLGFKQAMELVDNRIAEAIGPLMRASAFELPEGIPPTAEVIEAVASAQRRLIIQGHEGKLTEQEIHEIIAHLKEPEGPNPA